MRFDTSRFLSDLGVSSNDFQDKVLASDSRFKLIRAARRVGKSFTAAKAVMPYVLTPNTRGWIVGPCVDDQTEILSQRGWLSYQEVKAGDVVLTLNSDGLAEWQPCLKVVVQPSVGNLVHMKQRGHDSVTTANHRWLVGYISSNPKKHILGHRFTTTAEMTKPNEFVVCGAPVVNLPAALTYSDAFVELVGWYWTEGSNNGNGINISQNKGPRADRIREAAFAWLGAPQTNKAVPSWSDWRAQRGPGTCGVVYLNRLAAEQIRAAAPDKVLSPAFITALTQAQLNLLVDTSVRADGHQRCRGSRGTERVVVQKRADRLKALQMAVQLSGKQSVLRQDASEKHTLQIFERNTVWLGQKKALGRREAVPYDGDIWCPVTPNQTWLARRNGTVYFTGNTYDLAEKEFRYIVDILARANKKLGLPKPDLCHSNTKMGDLHIVMPWGAEVVGKSAERPLSLVGEELDWIILSEAAQHKAETWYRYLRPTLSSRMGSAIFPTTPDISGSWLYELELAIPKTPGWELFHCAAWDAPHYKKEEIESARKELSEDAFNEQYGGEWSFHKGRVFKAYSRAMHVVRPFQIPLGWRIYSGLDFGSRDATCVVWLAMSPAADVYAFKEYYANDRPTEVHAEIVKQMDRGLSAVTRVSDHHALGRQLVMDWRMRGLPSVDAKVDRKARRDRFMAMLEPRDYHLPYHAQQLGLSTSKYPRFFILEGACPNLEREILLLKWRDGRGQEGSFGDTIGDDHAIDATEYATHFCTRGRRNMPMHSEYTLPVRRPSSQLTGY